MTDRIDTTFPSGGEECAAYLYPAQGTTGPAPCVVMAHGFSATRDDRLPAYAERFAAAGLAALVFDYRHFGASTGEPRQLLDIARQQADYEAAVAYASTQDPVDGDRIALWGSSFSGGHVMALARRLPGITCAVAQAPFTDGISAIRAGSPKNVARASVEALADQAAAFAGRPPRYIPAVADPGEFAVMTAPEAKPGFEAIAPEWSRWRNEVAARVMLRIGLYRPAAGTADIAIPLLVCVCDRDETTPPEPAARAAERAPRGELRRYPVGHFDIYVGDAFERAVADQTEFLLRHLRER